MKYVIIGFGATGVNAAETIRKNDPYGEITIIGEEKHNFYSRILLHNFLTGDVKEENTYLKKEDFYISTTINTIKGVKAISIDSVKKEVVLNNGSNIQYDKLLISTGAKAVKFPNPNNISGIFNLYSLDDAKGAMEYLKNVKNALVLGAGYVGTDWMKALTRLGINIILVAKSVGLFSNHLPEEGYLILERKLEDKGIRVLKNTLLLSCNVDDSNKLTCVQTESGNLIETEFLGVGIGVTRDLDWLKNSGIECDKGVCVDDRLLTNIPDIYAAGDIAEYKDIYTGRHHLSGSWANATKMGQIAGQNMTGSSITFSSLPLQIISIFDIAYSRVGYGAEDLMGLEEKIMCNENNFEKMVYKDGKLVGASYVGAQASLLAHRSLSEIEKNIKEINLK